MSRSNVSVLVVEDEKLQSWSVARNLSSWGFDVRPALTGHEALAELEKAAYDVVLLDYQLPDVDGLEVARRARQIQPQAAIILITAFQENELPAHAGLIDRYFNKPLDMQVLRQAILGAARASTAV